MNIIGIISSVVALLVSVFGIVSVFVSIGQYKGRTDQRLDTLEKETAEQEKKITAGAASSSAIQTDFAAFTGEMRATMNYIQNDLRDIKNDIKGKGDAEKK